MRISTKVVWDLATGQEIRRESFEYNGPVAWAISFSGQGSKQKSQQQSQSTSESGTKFNEDFLTKAVTFANAKKGGPRQVSDEERQFDLDRMADLEQRAAAGDQQAANDLAFSRERLATSDLERRMESTPDYSPEYVRSEYTPGKYTEGKYTAGKFTAVAPEGFDRLEKALYEGQQAKANRAYQDQVARQREELSQMGALNSPAQYLEGSARSSLDRGYMDTLQQAARDAATQRIGLEEREAGRRTEFDVGEGRARTTFDVGEALRRTGFDVEEAKRLTDYTRTEAERETGFNERTEREILDYFLKKIALAAEAGRYSVGQASSSGTSSGASGGGGFGFLTSSR